MDGAVLHYPIELDRRALAQLLPHRGEMLMAKHLLIHSHCRFQGQALWHGSSSMVMGHGCGSVPSVLLIEALAQLAGAGLLAGDPYTRSLPGPRLGVLLGVRQCHFEQAVCCDAVVSFDIDCRQMGPELVYAQAQVQQSGQLVARLNVLIAYPTALGLTG